MPQQGLGFYNWPQGKLSYQDVPIGWVWKSAGEVGFGVLSTRGSVRTRYGLNKLEGACGTTKAKF